MEVTEPPTYGLPMLGWRYRVWSTADDLRTRHHGQKMIFAPVQAVRRKVYFLFIQILRKLD